MAGRIGHTTGQFIRGNENPNLSDELNDLTEVVSQFDNYDWRTLFYSVELTYRRVHTPLRRGIIGDVSSSFKTDYYERIHIQPFRIELGTVSSTVSRQVSVWNAYTKNDATLTSVTVNNGSGILAIGDTLPFEFTPLQERLWEMRITPDGPPEINANVVFDFSDVPDPLPVVITGNRAIVLPSMPDVPVKETWKWLTDAHVSVDGSEQRIGLRRVPRRSLSTSLVFDTEAQVREQYRTLLSALGRLFIPYFQYSSVITDDADVGDSLLQFNTARVDLRNDDYVLLIDNDQARLIQLDVISTFSATTKAPLNPAVRKGTKIVAVFPSIVPNNLTLQRPAVNNRATMTLSSTATYPRASHQRPGSTAELESLSGYYILERHPLANDDIEYDFDTGQETLDADTGLFDVSTDWEFTRVESSFQFQIRRFGVDPCNGQSGPEEFDYWRLFTDEMKGSLNCFLLSSYRKDQYMESAISAGADSMILTGPSYADNFWPAIPYHYIAIHTDAGIHYAEVTASSKNLDGNSAISFNPPLPLDPAWSNVQHISYLLKQRIVDDQVDLEHYAFDTYLSFKARTVKE